MKTSIKHDQRGLSNVLIIILAVVVIAVIGVVAWQVTKKDKDTTVTTKSAKSASKEINAACIKAYNDKELCKFTANYTALEKEPYKTVVTTTSAEGNNTSTILNDGKGNTSVVSTVGGKETAFMTYDKATYSKGTGETTWIKYPANEATATDAKASSPTSSVKINNKYDGTDNTITYKKIGKEKCGSANCLKYQVIDSTQPNTTTYVWFNTDNYRMARYTTKDTNNSTTDMTITYQSVKLSAPTPVKEFNAGADSAAMQQAQDAAAAAAEASQR